VKRRTTHRRLTRHMAYHPRTGKFTWRVNRIHGGKVGDEVGHVHRFPRTGRVVYRIYFDGRYYKASVLAWFYMTGEWPTKMVDHIDGDTLNNRWRNLRLATASQNAMNSKRPRSNTSGHKGVFIDRGRIRAAIKVDGKKLYLGHFETVEEAAAAYQNAALKYFGEFARW
jgi:HNH endonuclease